MAEHDLQSSFSTNVHEEQNEQPLAPTTPISSDYLQQSSVNPELWSAVSDTATRTLAAFKAPRFYASSQQSSSDTGTNTFVDDDLAETRSTISHTVRTRRGVAKRSKLFRSQSCDDLILRSPSILPECSFGKHYLDTAQKRARRAILDFVDDIRKALPEGHALRITPALDGTTIQDSSSTRSRSLSGATLNDDLDTSYLFWDGSTLGSVNANAVTNATELFQISPLEEELDLELLRLSQEKSHTADTACAFCGSVFSGPDQRQMCIHHILNVHHTIANSPATVKQQALSPRRLTKTPDKVGSKWLSVDPSETMESRSDAPLLSSSHLSRIDLDLLGVGAWCLEEDWIRLDAARPIIAGVVLTDDIQMMRQPNAKDLLDTILTLSRRDGPEADTERINDLFNGLDVVVEDLSRRFPEDETVRCISSVLNSVAQSAVPSTHSPQGNSPISYTSRPSGVRTYPVAQESGSANHSGLNLDPAGGEQHTQSSSGSSSPLDERLSSKGESRATPTVSVDDTKKKSKRRNLACPFRKHDEVHGRHPTCSHQGSSSMSGLKGHLKSNTHNKVLDFISLCRNCAHYIINISEWQTLHLTGLCIQHLGTSIKQIRGEGAVKQWQNLYMKKFPDSQRIPHPYTHNQSWQYKNVWTQRQDGEYRAMSAPVNFDFNQSFSPQPNQRISVSSTRANSTIPNVSPAYQSRNATLEPMTAENGGQLSTPITGSPDAPQTFLEEPHSTTCDLSMATCLMPFQQHSEMHEAAFFPLASTSSRAGQHDLTGIYSNDTPYQSPSHPTPMPQISTLLTYPTAMHSEPQGSNLHEIRIATLSVLADCLNGCLQAVTASSWALQAQRISQVHGMDTEESNVLGDELLETIKRRVEQICSEAAAGDQAPGST
ncbi:hypothetical protein HBH98_144490 [Parastagonospora nodorum]|nr:hypothetical protein HBH53_154170 [Parastagonospora nodorum]KAH3964948.1 hypothetical protein HBH51_153250 [Parastagonospora nodorum]KAH4014442.1 hypothetical protein HBI09_210540 [Parastagonospora nodorum]KAH4161194.1 hypothetical protein HBH43_168970 [Parastagonospora nodorum]KAH4183572.1 hypothetical protein HBH42_201470 [Parastagonospora nodorum]